MSFPKSLLTAFVLFGFQVSVAFIQPPGNFNLKTDETIFPKKIDANKDGKCWSWKNNMGHVYEYSETNIADDWLVSEGIELKDNHAYHIEIDVNCVDAQYPERVEVYMKRVKNDANDQVDSCLVIPSTDVVSKNTVTLSGTYTTGDAEFYMFYLYVHACSDPDMNQLHFTRFSIEDLGEVAVNEPKLSISDLRVDGDDLIAGYKHTLNATVVNNGNVDSDIFNVVFNGLADLPQSVTCQPLKAGESVTVTADYAPTLFDYEYNITADIESEFVDADSRTAVLSGSLSRPSNPAPRITEITRPIRYQAIIRWEMPNQADEKSYAGNAQTPGELLGFNIYRNQHLLSTVNASHFSYMDSNTWNYEDATYNVNAIYENGFSDISNSAKAEVITGVDDIDDSAQPYIVVDGGVQICSAADVLIADMVGRIVARANVTDHSIVIPVTSGIYILTINGSTYKIAVK